MSQHRILIVLSENSFAASATTDAGSPVPLDIEALTALVPQINAAALTEIESLKEEIAALKAGPSAPVAGEVSKLTIKRRLDALGKWAAFKALLTQLPESVQDDWTLAQAIRADDPLFVQAAPTIKAALDLTDEQFNSLLA